MAEFKGRRCDRSGCNNVVENVHSTPSGWTKLTPVINTDIVGRNGEEVMEFCCDYCVAVVAVERYENNTGKRFQRKPITNNDVMSEARIEGGKRAAHKRLHTNKNVVDEGCVYCVNDTSPKEKVG